MAGKRVITYGTFDLFHIGHLRLLKRAAALGDYLVVGLSTDEFNAQKNKVSVYPYDVRKEMLGALSCVDLVIPEKSWGQKPADIAEHGIDVLAMGSDWEGDAHFSALDECCDVVFLERTPGISTARIKRGVDWTWNQPWHAQDRDD